MTEVCPHCGQTLPSVVDAFCPECRGSLDEPPPQQGRDGAGPSGSASMRPLFGLMVTLGGVVGVISAVLSGTRGHIAEAASTGVVSLVIALAGLRLSASSG
jgi:hypothetical protein